MPQTFEQFLSILINVKIKILEIYRTRLFQQTNSKPRLARLDRLQEILYIIRPVTNEMNILNHI